MATSCLVSHLIPTAVNIATLHTGIHLAKRTPADPLPDDELATHLRFFHLFPQLNTQQSI